ncbi:MAG: hypothetical protein M5R42_05555 [Rhodocyclaceae bacterium]|nr:hypothetical protein [Rhodocyclaceae bacterium]
METFYPNIIAAMYRRAAAQAPPSGQAAQRAHRHQGAGQRRSKTGTSQRGHLMLPRRDAFDAA